ncbi:chitinase [Streptomyces sp. NBC_00271]|uniref:chitinase n=1 Tax=Streptomyces sp. NBC_00271 TaxID=2975697 RepID=UPI002E2D84B9|nr:chitinase [Streptomyces sp. NBC_00271]
MFSGFSTSAKSGSGFPDHYAAPFVQSWDSPSILEQARHDARLKYFNLAFIVDAGGCRAKLNGETELNDSGWISAINATRAAGGDVMASFGGEGGHDLAVSCPSVDSAKAQYRTAIDTLKLSRIDLDVEGKELNDQAANDRRNKALAQLQQEYRAAGKELGVNYTLPVAPDGLTDAGKLLLRNAESNGLDVNLVNIMAMDYGRKVDDMGGAAIDAANALHSDLHEIWSSKTDSQLWAIEGITPMVGVNDTRSEVFTVEDAEKLVSFATSKKVQQLAFWSLNRDWKCGQDRIDTNENCSGTEQSSWEFTRLITGIEDNGFLVPTQSTATPKPDPNPHETFGPVPPPATPATQAPPPARQPISRLGITGQVTCQSGGPVVGVWVQAAHGADSRFAAWRGIGDGASADWWTELPQHEEYSLHVGCGGTADQWGNENKTGTVSGPHNSFTCDDITGDSSYERCVSR